MGMTVRRLSILAAVGSLAGCYTSEMYGVKLANQNLQPRLADAPIPILRYVPAHPHLLVGHVVGFGKKGIGFADADGDEAEAQMRTWARSVGGDAIVGYGFISHFNFTGQGYVVKWDEKVYACIKCLTWQSGESASCGKCGETRMACPYCGERVLEPSGWYYCPPCKKADLGALCLRCGQATVCPTKCKITFRKAECKKCKKERSILRDEETCFSCAHPEWKPETFVSLDSGLWRFRCPLCKEESDWTGATGSQECAECDKWIYLIPCIHCKQVNARAAVGDLTCFACGKPTAIVQCRSCDKPDAAESYTGLHTCGSCRGTWYSAVCPHCTLPNVWDKYYATGTCFKCKKAFDLPKPPKVEGPPKGYLGLTIKDLPAEDCQRLMVPVGEAVVATEVLEGSPAEKCGLRVGDVIVRIQDAAGDRWNGQRSGYLAWIQSKAPGTTITVTVLRDEKTVKLEAALGELTD